MGGQVRKLCHAHAYARVNLVDGHARTHYAHMCAHTAYLHVYQRASERANERWRAGASRGGGRGGRLGRHTGDVILTKGRNIGVDLLKSRLFLARVPPSALPFWYFERPSRKRVDFSTKPLTDESVIQKKKKERKKKKRRVRRSRTATQYGLGISSDCPKRS